jgi:hypothetical protein
MECLDGKKIIFNSRILSEKANMTGSSPPLCQPVSAVYLEQICVMPVSGAPQ